MQNISWKSGFRPLKQDETGPTELPDNLSTILYYFVIIIIYQYT